MNKIKSKKLQSAQLLAASFQLILKEHQVNTKHNAESDLFHCVMQNLF